MENKKNCIAAIVLGIVGTVIGFLFIPIIGVLCGIAGIIICCVKKDEMNIKAGLILSIVAIVASGAMWVISAYKIMQIVQQMPAA